MTPEIKALLAIPIPKSRKEPMTFLEILRVPHYEVINSRIYQFYLEDSEEHGWKDLFLRTLIDLLINMVDSSGRPSCIIIENKIHISTWGNGNCAHIAGVQYTFDDLKDTPLTAYFEQTLKDHWIPLVEALGE